MPFRSTFLVLSVFGWVHLAPTVGAEDPLFETGVQSILSKKCGKCHGAKLRKGGLDLSTMEGIRRGGESGESAVADTVDDSILWIMVDAGDMPPEGEPPLTKQERELIHRWIATGAKSNQPVKVTKKQINQHDVLPIVLLRCVTCHGATLKRGGVDLRTVASMRMGGENGPAFIAGKPDESLMIQRIESEACPPREQLLKFFVKRPPSSEVRVLRKWIAAGAPEADIRPDIATTEPDVLVSDEDRGHWAFQSPNAETGKHSIDEFIEARLAEKGLTPSPEASRDTLIRRAYLDLIGMPPSLAEWEKWHHSDDPLWYRRMVDSLLASPRYGERWGRYWLDLAGYADSEGGVSADPVRKVAWKYRDYVIDAFNEDKPYDRFLLEQLAGDELLDYENAAEVTDEMVENLIATGFLRMGIDQTGSRTMNFVPERLGVISDAVTIVASGVMGLTMGCARCHSHKYDAIPHRDYYRFKAVFQGAYDEHDWLTFKNRTLSVATAEHRARVAKVNPKLQSEKKKLESRLKRAQADLRDVLLRSHFPKQSAEDRQRTMRALKVADNNRTLPQRRLVEMLQQAEVIPDPEQPPAVHAAKREVANIAAEIERLGRRMEPPLAIRALWDRGRPSPTYILRRGEYNKPGPLVGPGVPSVLTDGRTPFEVRPPFPNGTRKTGRRLAFAKWLTKPDHPLTSRVMVNRVWYHHFGTGIVKSLDNFGVKGERPSHPKLLDWLAVRFVDSGWSIKELHRLMMNSRTYKQSSHVTDERRKLDPQNRLLSRMSLKRMDAEALRDSMLFVTGKLDDRPGGPPDSIAVDQEGEVSVIPTADGRRRRSIYSQYRRTEIPTMMDTFDYPEMGPNCLTRSVSTVSPQSLMLMNNKHVRGLATELANRVRRLTAGTGDDTAKVEMVYRLALSRLPTEKERSLGVETLQELSAAWKDGPHLALETYCHTILNSAAFLYVD